MDIHDVSQDMTPALNNTRKKNRSYFLPRSCKTGHQFIEAVQGQDPYARATLSWRTGHLI